MQTLQVIVCLLFCCFCCLLFVFFNLLFIRGKMVLLDAKDLTDQRILSPLKLSAKVRLASDLAEDKVKALF
jgi:hypothetical protein